MRAFPWVLTALCVGVTTPLPARGAIVLESFAVGSAVGSSSADGLVLGCTAGLPVAGTASNAFAEQILGFWRWGSPVPSDVGNDAVGPDITALRSHQPNPFRGSTEFVFQLGTAEAARDVHLDLFDTSGRLVHRVVDSAFTSGVHHVVWDATDSRGRPVAPGVYFARFSADRVTQTRSVVILP